MRQVFAITTALLLASSGFVYAGANKVDICHTTDSETNPWVVISIADAAYDSHIAHGDIDVNDDGSCGDDGGDPGGPA